MRQVMDEYGEIVLGVVAGAALFAVVLALLSGGQIFDVIREFSQGIC